MQRNSISFYVVFEDFKKNGYRLNYFRIPICPEQAPEDNYFDEYVRVIKSLDPTDPLIFNCGMGVVRSKSLFFKRGFCQ